jgi:flavin-binding protein dodecin
MTTEGGRAFDELDWAIAAAAAAHETEDGWQSLDWVVVVHAERVDNPGVCGYQILAHTGSRPQHVVRGLLAQGLAMLDDGRDCDA